jgi:hypothetical protein
MPELQEPQPVDREAVRAHVVSHGCREAARAFGLSENTVLSWSYRFGWLADAGKSVIAQPLPKSMQSAAISAIKPHQAAQNTVISLGEKTRSRFARGIARGALKVANMKPSKVLDRAGEIKQLVDAGAKLHGWGADCTQATVVNLAFLSACGTRPEQEKSANPE